MSLINRYSGYLMCHQLGSCVIVEGELEVTHDATGMGLIQFRGQ